LIEMKPLLPSPPAHWYLIFHFFKKTHYEIFNLLFKKLVEKGVNAFFDYFGRGCS
jgi:hypothetical protein